MLTTNSSIDVRYLFLFAIFNEINNTRLRSDRAKNLIVAIDRGWFRSITKTLDRSPWWLILDRDFRSLFRYSIGWINTRSIRCFLIANRGILIARSSVLARSQLFYSIAITYLDRPIGLDCNCWIRSLGSNRSRLPCGAAMPTSQAIGFISIDIELILESIAIGASVII